MTALTFTPARVPWRWWTPSRAVARRAAEPWVAEEDPSWFFDLVGCEPAGTRVALRPVPRQADARPVWWLFAVPLLVPVQLALLALVQVAVPGWAVAAELAGLVAGIVQVDGKSLQAQGICSPPRWTALFPPLYLSRRARVAHHPLPAFGWGLAAVAGLLAGTAVSQALSPVPLSSTTVEQVLYQGVLDRDLPLDPGTAVIRCPRFERAWPGHAVVCTGQDAKGRLLLSVTPDASRRVTWRVQR